MAESQLPFVKNPEEPSLSDVLMMQQRATMLAINCMALATIQSFDSAKQTATATINYKRTKFKELEDGTMVPELFDYPILLDLPCFVLTGGAFSAKMPIKKGDTCFVLFNDRAIDQWFTSGQVGGVSNPRLHSFSDGIAVVGIKALTQVLTGYVDNMVVLGDNTHDLKLGVGEASLNVSTSRVRVKTKINIQNNSQNLYTLLNNLCTQLNSLTTQLSSLTVTAVSGGLGTSGPPSNAAAITAIGTQISTIATNLGGLLE